MVGAMNKRLQDKMEKSGIKLLTINEPEYAEPLKQDPLAPSMLFYRGILQKNILGVGVVGGAFPSSQCIDQWMES